MAQPLRAADARQRARLTQTLYLHELVSHQPTMTAAEVQSLLLRVLAAGADARLGQGQHYLSKAVIAASPPPDKPTYRQIMEGVWSLIRGRPCVH